MFDGAHERFELRAARSQAVERKHLAFALGWGALAFLLLPAIRFVPPLLSDGHGYLAVHYVMEAFSCAVSVLIFAVGWHAVRDQGSGHMAVLSAAFFAVTALDFAHLLSFPGMPPLVTASSTEKGIAFWLAARYAGALGLMTLALLPVRWRIGPATRLALLLGAALYVATALWAVLWHFDRLPRTFIPGEGLTRFKIVAEYGLVALHFAVAAVFLIRTSRFEGVRTPLLVAAALTLAASELPFTLYASANDAYNFAGHIYKVAGFAILYWAVFVDAVVTPYRRREQSEALYRQLTDQASVAILKLDADGRIVMANPCAVALFGRADLDGRSLPDLLDGKTCARLASADADRRPRAAALVEADLARADGHAVPVEISASRLEDGGRLIVVRDIGERKKAEAELIALKERAETANRAKSEFLANMSHELRTPLNAVLGFSDMLAHETLGPLGDPRYRDYARDIHSSGAHLLGMVSQLLDLAKIEAGRWSLTEEIATLQDVIADVARLWEPSAQLAKARILLALDSHIPPLRVDPQALRQILFNLLGNAIKFSPAGGAISVSLTAGAGGIALTVADQGPGIPKEDIARLGTPFAQVESAYNRKHGGTGLGLAIVRGLAELHQGRLAIDSTVGKGTRVTVEFPPERVVVRELRPSA